MTSRANWIGSRCKPAPHGVSRRPRDPVDPLAHAGLLFRGGAPNEKSAPRPLPCTPFEPTSRARPPAAVPRQSPAILLKPSVQAFRENPIDQPRRTALKSLISSSVLGSRLFTKRFKPQNGPARVSLARTAHPFAPAPELRQCAPPWIRPKSNPERKGWIAGARGKPELLMTLANAPPWGRRSAKNGCHVPCAAAPRGLHRAHRIPRSICR